MTQYLISYFGGDQPKTPEEGKAHFAKYQAWLNDLGEAVVSAMNPIKNTHSVNAAGSKEGGHGMSGYTIIQAESMQAAIAITQACPFVDINGTLEVSELINMGG